VDESATENYAQTLAKAYPKDPQTVDLQEEVRIFYKIHNYLKLCVDGHITSELTLLNVSFQKVLENVVHQMCICLRLLTVLPVSIASGEGSFNKLTFIPNRLRSTILEDRLYHLLTLSIEYEMAKDRVLLMSVMNSPKRRRGKNFNTIIRIKNNKKYKTSFHKILLNNYIYIHTIQTI
jgi:hypothetical protein